MIVVILGACYISKQNQERDKDCGDIGCMLHQQTKPSKQNQANKTKKEIKIVVILGACYISKQNQERDKDCVTYLLV
jgi:hypothetical protein